MTRRAILSLLLLTLAWALPLRAADRPAVLFTGGFGNGANHVLARQLYDTGYNLQPTPYPGLDAAALTMDRLKQFNVAVIEGLGRSNADLTLSPQNQQSLATLKDYLAQGGGVLLVLEWGQMITGLPAQDAFLKPLGLTPLWEEMPRDSAAQVATSWKLPFGYSTDLRPSPISEAVTGLWYPVPAARVGAQHHSITFNADNNWTVVAAGAPTSYTLKGTLQVASPTNPGTYSASVPLVALRNVGPGRLVVVGIVGAYLYGGNAPTTLEGVVMDKGIGGTPSGMGRLFHNALRWLAAPSLGKLGGAPMQMTMLEDPHKTKFGAPFDWSTPVQFPAVQPALPGVIGPRTKYSTGTATAAEWVTAAKARGLSWIAFLEEFSSLTSQEFDALKADCLRLSTPAFAVVPGFTIDDEVGNHYFYLGTNFPYVPAKFLDPTGKFFISRDGEFPDNMYQKGQLAMTVLDYAYSLSSFKLTAGNYLFSQDASPFANWFSNWDATGVITTRGGRLVEDATPDYLELADFGNGPTPMALQLMNSPTELARDPWRTVLRLPAQGGNTIDGPLGQATKVQDYLNAWHYYPDNPSRIYVTSGPHLESWCFYGPRDYGGDNRGDFVWQNYRWQLRCSVKSDIELKEITVYDGPTLFRRYSPRSARTFEFVLDLTHDQQHNFVVVATDIAGGKAVSGEQWDRNHRSEEFMCSDRNNQLSYGWQTTSDGTGIMLGGNQPLAGNNKRIQPAEVSPAGTFKNDPLLGAPAFDGATGGEPDILEVISARPKSGGEIPAPNVSRSQRLFCNGDVNVGQGHREHLFADKINVYNVWHTLWRTEPAKDFTVTRRNHFFQIDPDYPLPCFIWDMEIKLLRDLPNNGFTAGLMRTAETTRWVARGSDGNAQQGQWDGPNTWLQVPLDRGGYFALLDSPLGGLAFFPLTDGLVASFNPSAKGRVTLVLKDAASPQKAGETGHIRWLVVGIPRVTAAHPRLPADRLQVVERFYREFALDAGDGGYTATLQSGRITSRAYVLDVSGAASKCLSGTLEGNLLSSLPLRVSGLSDRASAYLYDRGQKKARPLGVFEGQAWATVPLHGKLDLFAGAPLLTDRPEVFVQVTQSGEAAWQVEVHNPTQGRLTVLLRANPYFDPFKGKQIPATLDLTPGTSKTFEIK